MKPSAQESTPGPRLPRHLPRSGPIALGDLVEIRGVELSEIVVSPQGARGVVIEESRLRRVNLSSSRLLRLRASDAIFERCDFTAGECIEAHLARVDFVHCRMLGMHWAALDARQVRFAECQCEGAFFVNSRLPGVRFERCSLRQVTFEKADLHEAVLHGCDLDEADLRGCDLAGADLRGSSINGLRVEARDLKGAILDPTQAMQVAGLLGIVVRDSDAP